LVAEEAVDFREDNFVFGFLLAEEVDDEEEALEGIRSVFVLLTGSTSFSGGEGETEEE
jgi:hypothetical protein